MRNYEKSTKLNNVCYDIRGPIMDEANRMAANGVNILKLNIGNPAPFRLFAPDEIVVDMIYNLRDTEGYSDSKGLFSARKAIMQYCQNQAHSERRHQRHLHRKRRERNDYDVYAGIAESGR